MKRMMVWVLALALLGMVAACGNSSNNALYIPPIVPQANPTVLATGGSSTSGSGGPGGYVYVSTYGGAVKVLKSGTIDAVFTVPTYTPDFGTNHAVVSAGTTTTVLVDGDDFAGRLCMVSGSPNLYVGDGNGTCDGSDTVVTGLTVESGAILALAYQGYCGGPACYPTIQLTNDLVINGTLTSDDPSGLYVEARTIDIENTGKIVTSATTTDSNGGEIYLGYDIDMTYQIINKGTIEANGLGNGYGGYVYLDAHDLVVNTGTIEANGGDSTVAGSVGGGGGGSGELTVYSDYGDFYSSGTVRLNAGKGANEGGISEYDACNWDCNYTILVEANYYGEATKNGDIYISGTWEAMGGDGLGGDGISGVGGSGGYIVFQTDTLGKVWMNATMSTKAGDSLSQTGSFSGGYTYGIDVYQAFDPWGMGGFTLPTSAGSIRIAGTYDLRGGSGDEMGGDGGYLEVYGNNSNQDVQGADVELVGFAAMNLNGGEGANGGSASGQAFMIDTYATASYPAGAIENGAKVEAKGGKGTAGAGGSGGTIILQGESVTNSADLTVNGGDGTTAGGNGGNITLTSNTPPTANTGTLSAAAGAGGTGTAGTVTVN